MRVTWQVPVLKDAHVLPENTLHYTSCYRHIDAPVNGEMIDTVPNG